MSTPGTAIWLASLFDIVYKADIFEWGGLFNKLSVRNSDGSP